MAGRSTIDWNAVASLTKEELAYLAGFFDGEGNVSVGYQANGRPVVRVALTQKRPAVLRWVHSIFGGTVHHENVGTTKAPNGNEYQRDVFRWSISGEVATEPFLTLLLPYLRIKKDEVLEALTVIQNKHTLTREQVEVHKSNIVALRKNGTTG